MAKGKRRHYTRPELELIKAYRAEGELRDQLMEKIRLSDPQAFDKLVALLKDAGSATVLRWALAGRETTGRRPVAVAEQSAAD